MSVNEILRNAILPIVPACEPVPYSGTSDEYCTFLCDDEPVVFAEGFPAAMVHHIILNWYLPAGVNPLRKKRLIGQALATAGFTYPYITNASSDVGQQFVFECDYVDGDV